FRSPWRHAQQTGHLRVLHGAAAGRDRRADRALRRAPGVAAPLRARVGPGLADDHPRRAGAHRRVRLRATDRTGGAAGPLARGLPVDGEVLTSSTGRSIGYAQVEGEGPYVHEQLSLDVGEHIYGLGERFGAFVKNGQSVDIWNADGGTNSEQAYKNVPFYLSSRGYGVLVDDAGPVSFEVGSENVSATQFSVPGERLRYEVYGGGTPLEVIERYTARSGRPPSLPEWSYGLWLSTSFTTDYDEETVLSFVDGMA